MTGIQTVPFLNQCAWFSKRTQNKSTMPPSIDVSTPAIMLEVNVSAIVFILI